MELEDDEGYVGWAMAEAGAVGDRNEEKERYVGASDTERDGL